MPGTTEAIRIRRHGGPEEMELATVPLAAPGPGEVLVRQDAMGVNYLDTYHRRGVFPVGDLPGGIGVEGAGTIEAVGPGVTRVGEGDRVSYAGPPVGAYARRRVLPEAMLIRLPDGIDAATAAAATLRGMTAHMLMTRVRPLRPGDAVLVYGGAGGLGLLLVQWARSLGARVFATVGSEAKAEAARAAGADAVILHRTTDVVAAVRDLTGGAGVDAVYEGVGGDTLRRALAVLKPFGVAVNLGQVAGPLPSVSLDELGPRQSLSVAVPGVFAHLRTLPDLQAGADELFACILDGTLRVHVGARFPLGAAADAHRLLESGESTGSIVLEAAAGS